MARQNAACQCEPKSIKKMQDWNIAPLERLGNAFAGEEWERAVAAAGGRNSWFTRGQVERAVAAVGGGLVAPHPRGGARLRPPPGSGFAGAVG